MEFVDNVEGGKLMSITCRMYRKDRARPTEVTEYMSECLRGTDTWKQWPARMRHKATIQAARYAFGLSGIYDEDEAQRMGVARKDMGAAGLSMNCRPTGRRLRQEHRGVGLAIKQERVTAEQIIARSSSRYTLSDNQIAAIRALERPANVDADGVIAPDDFTAAYNREESHA